jgi:hypothetical protein
MTLLKSTSLPMMGELIFTYDDPGCSENGSALVEERSD